MFLSMTAWIWSRVPAVMLEMVQHASFRIDLRPETSSNTRSASSAPALMTCCVCWSFPVTMLPTVRNAGTSTDADLCASSSTRRRTTPTRNTSSILLSSPSDKYDSAQQASVRTSSSADVSSCDSFGSAIRTMLKSGWGCGGRNEGGLTALRADAWAALRAARWRMQRTPRHRTLPRHRLDSVHVAFRSIETEAWGSSNSSRGSMVLEPRTRSRHLGESPAMFPNAQTACSRTSESGLRSSCTKMGTAPASITARVWSGVPDATFVSAHAASNWSCGGGRGGRACGAAAADGSAAARDAANGPTLASGYCRNCTNLGITP